MRVGFIGLGTMGSGMALNVQKTGCELVVHDLRRDAAKPHLDKVGKMTRAQAEQVAKTKMPDLTAANLEAAVRTVAGSARSMGVEVEGFGK